MKLYIYNKATYCHPRKSGWYCLVAKQNKKVTVRESRQKEKKKGFCEAKTNINDLMLYCDASTTLISSTSVVFFSI